MRIVYWAVLLVTALQLFAAVWIVIPVPDKRLLAFAVGAPEVSPVLLAGSLLLAIVAATGSRRNKVARLALVFSLISGSISLLPIL